jgi:hypothetical protein
MLGCPGKPWMRINSESAYKRPEKFLLRCQFRAGASKFIFCNISVYECNRKSLIGRFNLPDLGLKKDLGEDLIKWNALKNNLSFRGVSWHAFCFS